MRRALHVALGFLAFGLGAESAPAGAPAALPARALARLTPRLERVLGATPANRPLVLWVELEATRGSRRPADLVSERSLSRRRKVLPADALVDASDLPPAPETVAAVRSCVGRVRARSRWLDAVSVEATPSQIAAVRALPGVRGLDLVARTARHDDAAVPGPRPAGPGYGDAAGQLHAMRVDALHDRSLTGVGVLIAHLDTGYQSLHHEVFRTLRVAAAWDFVDGDANVSDSRTIPGDALDHGHMTLSVLAGFKPGKLVGVAPGATMILARTESAALEEAFEEDLWIAALEWADSLGADIVSSSLKFLEYDIPGTGYTWQDMDGATARVTRAANMAARRGMLIVNGAGNEGSNPLHNTLVAPADGDGVLAVGAVTVAGTRAPFSSIGPTTDDPPRIKPDVMAPGVDIVAADVVHDSSYTRISGTSLACPLAAGVAALLLSVHDATPAQVCDALRNTATRAGSPDNQWGWGTIDALAAYEYLIGLFPTDAGVATRLHPALRFANPFPRAGGIAWDGAAGATLRIYDASGRRVREWQPGGAVTGLRWDGDDDAGRPLPRGVYFVELQSNRGAALAARRKLTLVR